jgi:hypothetical protein
VNVLWAGLVILLTTSVAITAMLLVRRRAPEGSYFADGDRASGVFGVLSTGFAILLGFIVFLAFESYDASRAGAEAEALTVTQQVETAQFFDHVHAATLTGELVCYARSVVGVEWPQMASGKLGDRVSPWSAALFKTIGKVQPQSSTDDAAYGKWLDQTSDREQARRDRIHGAAGVIPMPLWIVLFFISIIIFVYMLFFADSGERALSQAALMGSVIAVVVSLLLLLQFLDRPYHRGSGALRPAAMERTLVILDQELRIAGFRDPLPCDAKGRPL